MLVAAVIVLASFGYVGLLFAIAYYGDKRADAGRSIIANPYIYALSLAVYCTSWTFYGSVGRAATSGIGFLPIYLGPTLMAALWWYVLLKMIRISKANRITSIADFIGSRYGKSQLLGGLVTVIAVVGGYLAVAHAMGETYTRRRMALGVVIGSANSYRYLLVGLLGLASVWAAWALFGWVPIAGSIVWGAAFFVSWLLGTAGFGAALLSRAGIKENFAGRLLPPEALTDEYLWATPQFGVPAGRRPGTRTPTRGT